MVEERTTDGKRIAQLLSSEVSGREDSGLDALDVTNADPDVEPSADGELAYEIAWSDETGDADTVLAEVYVHDDRARIEFLEAVDAAAEAAEEANLRVRPKAVRPPRTLVFVEDGAEVKRATDVLVAALESPKNSG